MIKKDNRKTANNNKRQADFVADLQNLVIKNNHQVKIYATKTAVVFSHKIMPIDIEDIQVLSLFTNSSNFEVTPEYTTKYYKDNINRLGAKVKQYTEDFISIFGQSLHDYMESLKYTYLDLDTLTITDYNFKTFEATIYCKNLKEDADTTTIDIKPYLLAYIDNDNYDFTNYFEIEKAILRLAGKLHVIRDFLLESGNSDFRTEVVGDLDETIVTQYATTPDFGDLEDTSSYVSHDNTTVFSNTTYATYVEIESEIQDAFDYTEDYCQSMLDYYEDLRDELSQFVCESPDDSEEHQMLFEWTGEYFEIEMDGEDFYYQPFGEDDTFAINALPVNFEITLKGDKGTILTLDRSDFKVGHTLYSVLQAKKEHLS